ncbi:MAG TPA: M23 family metallopeptidase [Bacilli bacterium]|nr:M23 family metallopeptidase [Bacilli bacterium]
MKKLVLRPFVLPTIYVSAVVLILLGAYFSALSLVNANDKYVDNLEYVNSSIIDNDIPVIKTDVLIKRPYSANVTIIKDFYETNSSEDEQINALLNFGDYYVPNEGIIYSADKEFDIYAVMSGTVASIINDDDLGTIVEIRHGNNLVSVYQSIKDAIVQVNDIVTQGQKIAVSGTNNMKDKAANQLHFELYYLNEAVNPETYYDKKISEL